MILDRLRVIGNAIRAFTVSREISVNYAGEEQTVT